MTERELNDFLGDPGAVGAAADTLCRRLVPHSFDAAPVLPASIVPQALLILWRHLAKLGVLVDDQRVQAEWDEQTRQSLSDGVACSEFRDVLFPKLLRSVMPTAAASTARVSQAIPEWLTDWVVACEKLSKPLDGAKRPVDTTDKDTDVCLNLSSLVRVHDPPTIVADPMETLFIPLDARQSGTQKDGYLSEIERTTGGNQIAICEEPSASEVLRKSFSTEPGSENLSKQPFEPQTLLLPKTAMFVPDSKECKVQRDSETPNVSTFKPRTLLPRELNELKSKEGTILEGALTHQREKEQNDYSPADMVDLQSKGFPVPSLEKISAELPSQIGPISSSVDEETLPFRARDTPNNLFGFTTRTVSSGGQLKPCTVTGVVGLTDMHSVPVEYVEQDANRLNELLALPDCSGSTGRFLLFCTREYLHRQFNTTSQLWRAFSAIQFNHMSKRANPSAKSDRRFNTSLGGEAKSVGFHEFSRLLMRRGDNQTNQLQLPDEAVRRIWRAAVADALALVGPSACASLGKVCWVQERSTAQWSQGTCITWISRHAGEKLARGLQRIKDFSGGDVSIEDSPDKSRVLVRVSPGLGQIVAQSLVEVQLAEIESRNERLDYAQFCRVFSFSAVSPALHRSSDTCSGKQRDPRSLAGEAGALAFRGDAQARRGRYEGGNLFVRLADEAQQMNMSTLRIARQLGLSAECSERIAKLREWRDVSNSNIGSSFGHERFDVDSMFSEIIDELHEIHMSQGTHSVIVEYPLHGFDWTSDVSLETSPLPLHVLLHPHQSNTITKVERRWPISTGSEAALAFAVTFTACWEKIGPWSTVFELGATIDTITICQADKIGVWTDASGLGIAFAIYRGEDARWATAPGVVQPGLTRCYHCVVTEEGLMQIFMDGALVGVNWNGWAPLAVQREDLFVPQQGPPRLTKLLLWSFAIRWEDVDMYCSGRTEEIVTKVFPGGPADREGVIPGSKLVSVGMRSSTYDAVHEEWSDEAVLEVAFEIPAARSSAEELFSLVIQGTSFDTFASTMRQLGLYSSRQKTYSLPQARFVWDMLEAFSTSKQMHVTRQQWGVAAQHEDVRLSEDVQECLFHLALDSEVRSYVQDPSWTFELNAQGAASYALRRTQLRSGQSVAEARRRGVNSMNLEQVVQEGGLTMQVTQSLESSREPFRIVDKPASRRLCRNIGPSQTSFLLASRAGAKQEPCRTCGGIGHANSDLHLVANSSSRYCLRKIGSDVGQQVCGGRHASWQCPGLLQAGDDDDRGPRCGKCLGRLGTRHAPTDEHPPFQSMLASYIPCANCLGIGHWERTCPHRGAGETVDLRELVRLNRVYWAEVLRSLGKVPRSPTREVKPVEAFGTLAERFQKHRLTKRDRRRPDASITLFLGLIRHF